MHSNRQGPEHGMRPDERKKKTMKEYFAYGSNLNLGQMAGRCPESTTVQIAGWKGMNWPSEAVFLRYCRKKILMWTV